MGKNEAIKALSQTLFDKAEENKKLAESLSLLKNQLMQSNHYYQKYYVQKIGSKKTENVTF